MRMAPVREQQAGFAPVGEQQREDGEDATTRDEKIVGSSHAETPVAWEASGKIGEALPKRKQVS